MKCPSGGQTRRQIQCLVDRLLTPEGGTVNVNVKCASMRSHVSQQLKALNPNRDTSAPPKGLVFDLRDGRLGFSLSDPPLEGSLYIGRRPISGTVASKWAITLTYCWYLILKNVDILIFDMLNILIWTLKYQLLLVFSRLILGLCLGIEE